MRLPHPCLVGLFVVWLALGCSASTEASYDVNDSGLPAAAEATTTTEAAPTQTKNLRTFRIGFLPALTNNKFHNKHFLGAFKYALIDINDRLGKLGYQLEYLLHDNRADTAESLRGMTEMYMNDAIAFIGPEETCATEARLAAAWNLPIFVFKCRESAVSNKNGLYPTFIRTIPSTAKVSKSVIALMKHFGWSRFQAIVGNTEFWMETAWTLRRLSVIHDMHMNEDEFYNEPYVGQAEIPQLIERTYRKTRIYVFLGDGYALIDFVRVLSDRGLNNGEYVVLAVQEDPYNRTLRHKYFTKYLEEGDLEEHQVEPFRSVLLVIPSPPSNPKFNDFLETTRAISYDPPFNHPRPPYADVKMPVQIYAAYLYDAVHLYARSLTEVLAENGNPRNGSALVAKMIKRLYQSIQGHTNFIDMFGNVEANYTVVSLLPDPDYSDGPKRRSMQPVGSFITHLAQLPDFSDMNRIEWYGGSTPVSEPACGFDGSKCVFKPDWPILVVCLMLITSSVIIIALVCLCRHYICKQKLASLLWKIDYKELLTVEPEIDPVVSERLRNHMFARLSNVTLESPAVNRHRRVKIASYKGSLVAIKILKKRHVEITRAVKKELYLMKELTHDNLNRFIGAAIEPPLVCIVMHYCSRGSLKDIMENGDIHLDDMFIASLVFDLIKGMIYLHDSLLVSHGNLKPSNCLVDSRWVLQIADFGLNNLKCRDTSCVLDQNMLYEKLLWTAPEILRDPCCPPRGTQKGDVYSFALILYEMHGRVGPWGPISLSAAEIVELVKNPRDSCTFRPDLLHLKCKEFIERCIQQCWQEDPDERPDFKYIRQRLKPMQQGLIETTTEELGEMIKTNNPEEINVDEDTYEDEAVEEIILEKQRSVWRNCTGRRLDN